MPEKNSNTTFLCFVQVPDAAKHRPMVEMIRRTDCTPVDILQCFYGLSALEICTFLLIRREKLSVQEIADKVHRNTSSVQRALKKLSDLRLLQREKIPGKGQGYSYEYRALSTEELTSNILELAEEIRTRVGTLLASNDWLDDLSGVLLKEIPK